MWQMLELTLFLIVATNVDSCSVWQYPSGDGNCSCGPTLGTVIVCNEIENLIGVLYSYCLTSNGDRSNTSVVGRCLAAISKLSTGLLRASTMALHVGFSTCSVNVIRTWRRRSRG